MNISIYLKKIMSLLFTPLSWVWEFVYIVRRSFYDYGIFKQEKVEVPIISVGNLTFGGTGKTPFILWLSKYILESGKLPMILTRGYKGKFEHSHGILKGGKKLGHNPILYGDEPLIFSRRLKDVSIIVGKNRSQNLKYYFNQESPDIVLLDDGHQHLKLQRDLNIVLFDSLMPLDQYKVAPSGYMREGFHGIGPADLIVLARADLAGPEKLKKLEELIYKYIDSDIPLAYIKYRPSKINRLDGLGDYGIEFLEGKRVVCIAGIGSPSSFYNMITPYALEVSKCFTFPDHHYFSPSDMEEVIRFAEENDAIILTTEKDMVKMRRVVDNTNIYYLEVDLEFLKGEKETQEIVSKLFNHGMNV